MHGGALAQKASKQKELSDHKLVKASNKRHGGGYSACALDTLFMKHNYLLCFLKVPKLHVPQIYETLII